MGCLYSNGNNKMSQELPDASPYRVPLQTQVNPRLEELLKKHSLERSAAMDGMPWSDKDIRMFRVLFLDLGRPWPDIAYCFPNRSVENIKRSVDSMLTEDDYAYDVSFM